MYEQFGTYGAWLNPALGDAPRVEYAPELEELGFQTIWVGIGLGHPEVRDSYVKPYELRRPGETQAGQRRRRIGCQQCCRTHQGQPARR
jgi:hypothetical protein